MKICLYVFESLFLMSASVASSASTTLHVVFTHSIPEQL